MQNKNQKQNSSQKNAKPVLTTNTTVKKTNKYLAYDGPGQERLVFTD